MRGGLCLTIVAPFFFYLYPTTAPAVLCWGGGKKVCSGVGTLSDELLGTSSTVACDSVLYFSMTLKCLISRGRWSQEFPASHERDWGLWSPPPTPGGSRRPLSMAYSLSLMARDSMRFPFPESSARWPSGITLVGRVWISRQVELAENFWGEARVVVFKGAAITGQSWQCPPVPGLGLRGAFWVPGFYGRRFIYPFLHCLHKC